MFFDSTIAAISTAYGESGIGIVRLSGPDSLSIAQKIFCPAKNFENGKIKDPARSFLFKPRYMHFGYIVDPETEKMIDQVLAVYMMGPHSYTGEDCVEIQCHGSMISLRQILALCIRMGAEPADKGEYTKRAFVNGRMDLSQAEAVIDLIKSENERSFFSAAGQMIGSLSAEVKAVRSLILEILVALTVEMDYPDEDIEETTREKLLNDLEAAAQRLETLLLGAREGKIVREGLDIAIVGKPNVGKSSLMNVFLKENRSIVTDIPGTTRDTIEEKASVRGIALRLTDTAGIRNSDDLVESLGIERSKHAFDKADMILLVIDGSRPLSDEDLMLMDMAKDRKTVIIINKQDLPQEVDERVIRELCPDGSICRASIAGGVGIDGIEDAIESFVYDGSMKRNEDPVLSNERHIGLVRDALESLKAAMEMTERGEAFDFVEIDIRNAFDLLGEITGDTASDRIINTIFERFCLGK